jgi:putative Mg2+ transporter-C (MgtC) family protein
MISAERGRLTLHVLEQELGPVTGRISTFIVQQQGEGSTMDDVLIAFSRMSENDFQALIDKLQRIPGVLKLDAKGRTERRAR